MYNKQYTCYPYYTELNSWAKQQINVIKEIPMLSSTAKMKKNLQQSLSTHMVPYTQLFLQLVHNITAQWLEQFLDTTHEYQFIYALKNQINLNTNADLVFRIIKSTFESPAFKAVKEPLRAMRKQMIMAMEKYNQDKLANTNRTPIDNNVQESLTAEKLTKKFYLAIRDGNIAEAKQCIALDVDVNQRIVMPANTPYYSSIHVSEAETTTTCQVTTLVGQTPLYLATGTANLTMVCLLLEAGARSDTVENNGLTPLMLACHQQFCDVVNLLITSDAPVKNETIDGSSALSFAAGVGNEEIINSLLAAHADINQADHEGETPLLIATARGHSRAVALLLKSGAIVDRAKPNGVTPAFIAAQNGYLTILDLLVQHRASLAVTRQPDGISLLQVAAALGRVEIVSYLIKNGADIRYREVNNMTAYNYATMANHTEIAVMLNEALEQPNAFMLKRG